jgi:hypothetical protein
MDGAVVTGGADGTTTLHVRYGDAMSRAAVAVQAYDKYPPVDFRHDVIPVFSKLGCNSGGCHGKQPGQSLIAQCSAQLGAPAKGKDLGGLLRPVREMFFANGESAVEAQVNRRRESWHSGIRCSKSDRRNAHPDDRLKREHR